MKLYATITSERATKGQGGNEYIIIELLRGNTTNPRKIGRLYFTEDAIYWLHPIENVGQQIMSFVEGDAIHGEFIPYIVSEKVKRQKGEKCSNCDKLSDDLIADRDDDGWYLCPECR